MAAVWAISPWAEDSSPTAEPPAATASGAACDPLTAATPADRDDWPSTCAEKNGKNRVAKRQSRISGDGVLAEKAPGGKPLDWTAFVLKRRSRGQGNAEKNLA
jgi:hypothetical protein